MTLWAVIMACASRFHLGATTAIAVGATVAGLALGSSCFIEGFVLVEATGGALTTPSGATGGAGQGGQGGAAVCGHATWPAPPASADPGTDTVDFVVAARSIDFGEEDISNGPAVGYDLDNHCTCQGEGDSCREPDWAAAEHCDGPNGRDNAIAQLFHDLGTFDEDFTSAHYTQRAAEGRNTILLRVRSYNGLANDDQVTVSIHPSKGLDQEPCLAPGTIPAWDGNDLWPINVNSLNAGTGGSGFGGAGGGTSCGDNGHDRDDARYIDENAYVNEWQLVANLPQVALEFISDNDTVPVQLTAGFVTGRIESQGSAWYVRDGLMVGRWKLTEFFRLIGSIPHEGALLCTNHPVYPLIKSAACLFPDIASELSGPTTPCDALSFAMALEGYPAQIGSVLPEATPSAQCASELDPQFDTCDPS